MRWQHTTIVHLPSEAWEMAPGAKRSWNWSVSSFLSKLWNPLKSYDCQFRVVWWRIRKILSSEGKKSRPTLLGIPTYIPFLFLELYLFRLFWLRRKKYFSAENSWMYNNHQTARTYSKKIENYYCKFSLKSLNLSHVTKLKLVVGGFRLWNIHSWTESRKLLELAGFS